MNGVNRLATKDEKILLNTDKTRKNLPTSEKKIVNCSSRDHRNRLTTEAARIRSKSNRQLFVRRSPQKTHDRAARIRSKSNRQLFVRRSPQKTHDRSRKDPQQKQSLVVFEAITAKDSRQKPQGFAAKAIVGCSSSDHRKRLTTEAARIRSKSNR